MLLTKDSLSSYRPYEYDIKPWIQLAQLKAEREKMLLDKQGSFKDVFDDNKSLDAIYGLQDSEDPFKQSLWKQYVNTENKKRAITNEIAKGVNPTQFSKQIQDIKTETKKQQFALAAITARDNLQADYNNNNSNFIYSEIPEKVGYDRIVQNWTPFKISIKNVQDEATKAGKAISGSVTNDEFNTYNQYRINQISERGVKYEDLQKMLANGDFDEVLNNIRSRVGYDKIIDEREKDRLNKIIVSAFMNGFSYKTSSKLTPNGTPSRKTGNGKNKGKGNPLDNVGRKFAEGGEVEEESEKEDEIKEKEENVDKNFNLKQNILDKAYKNREYTLKEITKQILGRETYNENNELKEIDRNIDKTIMVGKYPKQNTYSNTIDKYNKNEIDLFDFHDQMEGNALENAFEAYNKFQGLLSANDRENYKRYVENRDFNKIIGLQANMFDKLDKNGGYERDEGILANFIKNLISANTCLEKIGNIYNNNIGLKNNIEKELLEAKEDEKTKLGKGSWSISDRGYFEFPSPFGVYDSLKGGRLPSLEDVGEQRGEDGGDYYFNDNNKMLEQDTYVVGNTSGRGISNIGWQDYKTNYEKDQINLISQPYGTANTENGERLQNDADLGGFDDQEERREAPIGSLAFEVQNYNETPPDNMLTYNPNEGQLNQTSFNIEQAGNFSNPFSMFKWLHLKGTGKLDFKRMVQNGLNLDYEKLVEDVKRIKGENFGGPFTIDGRLREPSQVRHILLEVLDNRTIDMDGYKYKAKYLRNNYLNLSKSVRDKVVENIRNTDKRFGVLFARYYHLYNKLVSSGLLHKGGIKVEDVNKFFKDYAKSTLEDFGNKYSNNGQTIALKQLIDIKKQLFEKQDQQNNIENNLKGIITNEIKKRAGLTKEKADFDKSVVLYMSSFNGTYKPIINASKGANIQLINREQDLDILKDILKVDKENYSILKKDKVNIDAICYSPEACKMVITGSIDDNLVSGKEQSVEFKIMLPLQKVLYMNEIDKNKIFEDSKLICGNVNTINKVNAIPNKGEGVEAEVNRAKGEVFLLKQDIKNSLIEKMRELLETEDIFGNNSPTQQGQSNPQDNNQQQQQ